MKLSRFKICENSFVKVILTINLLKEYRTIIKKFKFASLKQLPEFFVLIK